VQQVSVEQQHRAGCQLDRHRIVVGVREVIRLDGAVVARVVVLPVRIDDAWLVRSGQHPEAAVLDSGVIQRDPCRDQRAVPGRDEHLALVPGLAGLASAFTNSIDCIALDVRPDDPGERVDDSGMAHHVKHQPRQLVGVVNAHEAADDVVVGVARCRGDGAVDLAELSATDPDGLRRQGVTLGTVQRVRQDDESVLVEAFTGVVG
jgi:hypothetical protein